MIDVHPPEHTPHTWRDFFIHIATIVLGLVIAVGIEQAVEYIHHRREVAEARRSLRAEYEANRKFYPVNVAAFRVVAGYVQNDLLVLEYLQKHPGAGKSQLPGVLVFGFSHEPAVDSAWKDGLQPDVAALMPRAEIETDAKFYLLLHNNNDAAEDLFRAMTRAADYAVVDPDPTHMSPAQLATEIDLVKTVAEQDFIWGVWLANMHRYYPDFQPAPTDQEVFALTAPRGAAYDKLGLAAAEALTDARLADVRAAHHAALNAAGDYH